MTPDTPPAHGLPNATNATNATSSLPSMGRVLSCDPKL